MSLLLGPNTRTKFKLFIPELIKKTTKQKGLHTFLLCLLYPSNNNDSGSSNNSLTAAKKLTASLPSTILWS